MVSRLCEMEGVRKRREARTVSSNSKKSFNGFEQIVNSSKEIKPRNGKRRQTLPACKDNMSVSDDGAIGDLRLSANDDEMDPCDPDVMSILNMMETIREVLGRDYVNVVDRLKLNWIPQCVDDQEYCRSHHHRRCPRPKLVDPLQSHLVGTYSKHNRMLHYLKAVQDMCTRSEFPGEMVIKKIVELILVSQQQAIIQHCILVAEMVIMKFPPCWPDVNRAYEEVLLGGMDVRKFHRRDGGSSLQGTFEFTLELLLETIQCPDQDAPTNCSDGEDESECFSFDHFLKTSFVEDNFWQLRRQEKLDRLFAVLNIYAKILECDMSIWLLRYPSKSKDVMFSEDAPLVAKTFFDGTYSLMTGKVKKYLEIFVTCVGLRFPSSAIDVLTRFMNLISVAVVSCEKQDFEKVQYPNIGMKVELLVRTIYKTMLDKFSCRIHNFLLVINAIQIPFVKFLLIDQLLIKMNPDNEEMNVNKVVLLFKRKRWHCMEGTRQIDASLDGCKYPKVSPRKTHQRRKSDEIFVHEYLDLLLDCLDAYCETYQIPEVIRRAFAKQRNVPAPPVTRKYNKSEIPSRRLNMDAIENDIAELELKFNRKVRFLPYNAEEMMFTDLYVRKSTFSRYRDDIKYLGILANGIKILYAKHPELFRKWHAFLEVTLKPSSSDRA